MPSLDTQRAAVLISTARALPRACYQHLPALRAPSMVAQGTCASEPCAAPNCMPPAGVPPNMPTCARRRSSSPSVRHTAHLARALPGTLQGCMSMGAARVRQTGQAACQLTSAWSSLEVLHTACLPSKHAHVTWHIWRTRHEVSTGTSLAQLLGSHLCGQRDRPRMRDAGPPVRSDHARDTLPRSRSI